MEEEDDLASGQTRELIVPRELAGQRMDHVLSQLLPEYSRSRLQKWLREGNILIDNAPCLAKAKAAGGERIQFTPQVEDEVQAAPQDVPLQIVYEDSELIVLDKPAALVVHPAAGNPDGTVQNGLLYRYPELVSVPRAGIVHRLDKDTTGLLVVARNLKAHHSLVAQLQARTVQREYHAVVAGVMVSGGTVDAPIGRHPHDRKRMAVVEGGKEARTHFRVVERFHAHTLVKLLLETGRTHQIRVHMAFSHYPVVGDPVYGGRLRILPGTPPAVAETLRAFKRQALHARRLRLLHPATGQAMEWSAPLPADMQHLVDVLRAAMAPRADEEE